LAVSEFLCIMVLHEKLKNTTKCFLKSDLKFLKNIPKKAAR
jgi:hypothetical protein